MIVHSTLPVCVALSFATIALAGANPPVQLQPKAGAPLVGLSPAELALFETGKTVYGTIITVPQGQGPIMNKTGCFSCHAVPLGGWGTISVVRFGVVDENGIFSNYPGEEQSLRQELTIQGGCEEIVPEDAHQAFRVSNSSLAFGMIEAIADADIAANADPDDENEDGISGRVHWVLPLESGRNDPLRAGRFGWKAQVATVLTFSGDAARNEMGLTNALVPTETAPNGNLKLLAACDQVADPEDVEDAEGFSFIEHVTNFQRYLGVPPQTPKSGMTGEALFTSVGCAKCHIPEWTTQSTKGLESAIAGKTIRPYSDFLLHDIGAFADMISQDDASETEMRTPTLWNLRTRPALMHDGSISGGEFSERVIQAIALHGLFGEGSEVAANFEGLGIEEQDQLIDFLGSLGRREFDSNGDGNVDGFDLPMIRDQCLNAFVTPDDPCAVHDINQDGYVYPDDLAFLLEAWDPEHTDCNGNGQDDVLDIVYGLTPDINEDGLPDPCACFGDLTNDFEVGGGDITVILGDWGPNPGSPADLNLDGVVDGADITIVLGNWGACQ